MFKVNEDYLKLPGSYLFSTIGKKVAAYSAANPDKSIIRLGIGDVTQPLAPAIIDALHGAVDEMAHAETFHGYAPDLGYEFLFRMVQREILVISRRFLPKIIRLLYVILYIRYMWIPMLWQDVPVLMIQRQRHGVM